MKKTNKELLKNLIKCIIEKLPFKKFVIYQEESNGRVYNKVNFLSKDIKKSVSNMTDRDIQEKLRKVIKWLQKEYPRILVGFYIEMIYICGDKPEQSYTQPIPQQPYVPPYNPWEDSTTKWTYDWDTTTTEKWYIKVTPGTTKTFKIDTTNQYWTSKTTDNSYAQINVNIEEE